MSAVITQDELLSALESAIRNSRGPSQGVTVSELQKLMGNCGKERVWTGLRELKDAGMLIPVRRATTDIAGRPSFVPAYLLKKPAKKK